MNEKHILTIGTVYIGVNEYMLENIIKKSNNHLEVLNAQRKLNALRFNHSKRKNTKKQG